MHYFNLNKYLEQVFSLNYRFLFHLDKISKGVLKRYNIEGISSEIILSKVKNYRFIISNIALLLNDFNITFPSLSIRK
jgi:hypothetical protein